MAQRFTFDNAFLHFAKADGPRGFLWKYLASYACLAISIALLGYVLFRPFLTIWFEMLVDYSSALSEAEREVILMRRVTEIAGRLVFSQLLLMLLGVLFWAVFEAALQRRYVREEGFRLRLGGDEFRLILVGLIWMICGAAASVVSLFLIGASTASLVMALDNPVGGALVIMLAGSMIGFFWLWIVIRLAPASAMTVRDRKLSFFNAWGATRGRFWSLLGAYIILAIIVFFIVTVAYFILGTAVAASIWANMERFVAAQDNPLALFNAVMQFDILGPLILSWVGWIMLQGLIQYMWAGPAALAAKTDPRGGGVAQAPEVFA